MRARLFPVALAFAACRPGGAPPHAGAYAVDPCLIAPPGASLGDSAIIATEGAIDATVALRPRSPAEKLVFAQVYETLVRVACDGQLAPALAERWIGDSTGRRWTLTIRRDATFSDGAPVTANDVAMAWRERRLDPGVPQDPRGPALEGVAIESEREITVHLRDAHRGGPRLLADPSFAVHRRVPSATGPLGTGLYRAPSIPESGGLGNVDPATTILVPRMSAAAPVLVLRAMRSGDARDLIDQGVDVLVTSDRRVTDYAATQRDLQARPLPPDRAYALLSTLRRASAAASSVTNEDPRWAALRASLARDVIRTDSRAGSDAWWGTSDEAAACAAGGSVSTPAWNPSTAGGRERRLVYPAADRVAGELARRVVALAAYDRGASAESAALRELLPELVESAGLPLIATGLSDAELSLSLMGGAELGYLVALPRQALDPCAAWRSFATRAPWVTVGLPALIAEAGPTLITSARAPALSVDWDNTVRVVRRNATTRAPR